MGENSDFWLDHFGAASLLLLEYAHPNFNGQRLWANQSGTHVQLGRNIIGANSRTKKVREFADRRLIDWRRLGLSLLKLEPAQIQALLLVQSFSNLKMRGETMEVMLLPWDELGDLNVAGFFASTSKKISTSNRILAGQSDDLVDLLGTYCSLETIFDRQYLHDPDRARDRFLRGVNICSRQYVRNELDVLVERVVARAVREDWRDMREQVFEYFHQIDPEARLLYDQPQLPL